MREPIERLRKKVQRENLWIFIFHLLNKKERAVNEIRELVRKEYGFLTGNVTAYKVLFLLERGGYVKSYYQRNKKFYRITEKGRKQLKKAVKFFEATSKGLKR